MQLRTRSRGSKTPLNAVYNQVLEDCGKLDGSYVIEDAFEDTERMTDIVTKDYHERRKRGEIIINPMSRVTTMRNTSGTTGSYSCPGDPCTQKISVTHGAWLLHPSRLGLVQHAPGWWEFEQGTLKKLAGTQAHAGVAAPEWEGLVFLAELKETAQFLINPIAGFQRKVRQALKQKRLAAKCKRRGKNREKLPAWLIPHCSPKWSRITVADFMGEFWLQYRLGILPLAYDIESLIEARIKDERLVRPTKRISRGKAEDMFTRDAEDVIMSTWNATRSVTTNVTAKARAGVIYQPDYENSYGFKWQEVPSAVWEAATLSFVIDRFSNVGDWIRAIQPKVGVKYLGEWTSFSVEKNTVGDTVSSFKTTPTSCSNLSSPTAHEELLETYYSRHKGVTTGLAFRPVPYKDLTDSSWNTAKKHVLDHLALLRALLRTK